MKALVVRPMTPGSAALLEVPEPPPDAKSVLVATLAVGICGTDREIVNGQYGQAPPEQDHLVIGHESVGRVLDAPWHSGFKLGDLVVGVVRQPDPVPCANCAVGEWDMCENGLYREHGIKELHGFAVERYRIDPRYLLRVDPRIGEVGVLVEPASIVAKAWEHIERVGERARFRPRVVLVTGAGTVGLLAALLGCQRHFDVHVADRVTHGPKPELVRALGATFHPSSDLPASLQPDIIVECTGAGEVVIDALHRARPNGVICLTGLSSGKHAIPIDVGALNAELVLENNAVVGTVNANLRHYQAATRALECADISWLQRLLTRRVPMSSWQDAFVHQPDDVKTVLTFDAART